MVLEALACKHCGQTQQVKRYGTTPAGTQRYRCYDCGRTFVKTYTRKACDPSVQKQIVPMVLNGAGVRDTARVLGINRNTVSTTFKKKSTGPSCSS
jgi:transposase-like protein